MKHILVVDDAAANRILIKHILVGENYQIIEASNGQEALQLIAEHIPDLIILDILMPIMSGWEVAEIVKSQADTAHVPIIGISSEMYEEQAKAQAIGFSALLMRPFDVNRLRALVEEILAE